jgi:peroxiredoxin
MKRLISLSTISLFAVVSIFAQGYNVGDKASDFKLKNVDGKSVSLKDFPKAKGFVVVFTCNHCPYAKAYQDRITELDKKYKPLGYPVIAINSDDPQYDAQDSFDGMVKVAKDNGYTFPYLLDENQDICKKYGATRTPQVFLLEKKNSDFVVRYTGAIDDNYQDASKVANPYVAKAIDALLTGNSPNPTFTKAIGCSIKPKMSKT